MTALVLCDIDNLKQVNDAGGHEAGDRALCAAANALVAAAAGHEDAVVGRFGGDEFCVLLPETELDGALVVAERIRSLVEQNAINPAITVSIGVAAHRGGEHSPDELVALADRAAYRAKFSGRNTVAVPPSGDPVHEAERVLLDALDAGA